jgi:hypothetical protein
MKILLQSGKSNIDLSVAPRIYQPLSTLLSSLPSYYRIEFNILFASTSIQTSKNKYISYIYTCTYAADNMNGSCCLRRDCTCTRGEEMFDFYIYILHFYKCVK